MMPNLLREYIELLLSESAEEDSQLVGPEEMENQHQYPELANVLRKLGVKTIPSGKSSTGFAGMGSFGTVYEILYKGHRAALKITADSQRDFAQYKKLYEIQSKIPNFVRRSLPHIYSVKTFQNKHGKYNTTIMEFLNPLSDSLKHTFIYNNFPDFGDSSYITKKYSIEDPRIEHLYISLRWLIQHGMLHSWDDIRSDNVLVRPSTGDFVVADVGMFKWT